MKVLKNIGAVIAACFLLFLTFDGNTQEKQKQSATRPSSSKKTPPVDAELARLRSEVIEKMKESRASAEKLLEIHEEQKTKLTNEYQRRREFYSQGLISRSELNLVERALAEAIVRVEEDKRWLTESDIAITEATMRDELLRLPGLAIGGYSETGTLLRFNGGASWSLADAPKIEKFFLQTFGRGLPVTAFGQTVTHDRLRFDHRNAIDVALHPDSAEGRSLLAYLRQTGIPFIAFRGAVLGAATGAHIHIGPPSVRTIVGADFQKECCKR
ncbi:MAG TPA: hypothetical protein VLJ79_20560 [Candidatus Binatia bacterium]|nr:hypothetical protein [Candidatus Binatia bacterium]